MKTIGQFFEDLDDIESCARALAYTDLTGDQHVTLDTAIGDLRCVLDREPAEREKRIMISRYGHWLRHFEKSNFSVFLH